MALLLPCLALPLLAKAGMAGRSPAKVQLPSPSLTTPADNHPAPAVAAARTPKFRLASSRKAVASSRKKEPSRLASIGENVVNVKNQLTSHLARITAYWAGEGDYYTGKRVSATGIHLHGGHCAVDPRIIPYGSVVEIPGVGQFLAVDTGSAVISRTAAREAGHNKLERGALVVDLFFEHRREGERFAARNAKFVSINWWTPASMDRDALQARSLFADEDWNKIYSKQL